MSPFSIVLLRWAIALIPLAVVTQILERPDWWAGVFPNLITLVTAETGCLLPQ